MEEYPALIMVERTNSLVRYDMERENYYILLELGFDPPVNDPAEIKAAIRAKRQQWTRLQEMPGRRSTALRYLELVPDMEDVMLDPGLRAQEAAEAQTLREGTMARLEAELRVLEGKGYLMPRELNALAAKYKPYGVGKEMVERQVKVPVSESAPTHKSAEPEGEVLDRATGRTIRRNLEVLGYQDLYEFLEEAPYSSLKKLTEAAEAKQKEAAQSAEKNARSIAAQELAGFCLQLFETFDEKQKYDRYLRISAWPELGDLIEDEAARSGFISPEAMLRLVNFGMATGGGSVLEFEQYIRSYCAAYEIPIDARDGKTTCPACQARMAKGAVVCTNCAAPLEGECPECKEPFSDGAAICPVCGFSLGEMVKALQHIDESENALIESNWSSAQRGLQYAQKYWPTHPKVEVLARRAKRLEERYASYVESIADCVQNRQYYAALELIQEAQARRIRLPSATISHVEKVIADIEGQVQHLQEHPGDINFERVYALVLQVGDSIELDRMLAQYPPEPPGRLVAGVQGADVRLSWEKSPSAGMIRYIVVRKQHSIPLTAYDGDVLYEGGSNSFLDKTPEPLTEYYYSVYVKRGNTFSDTAAVAAAPSLVVPEIQNLRILPISGGAQITWDFDPLIREVLIWRKISGDPPSRPGEGLKLDCDRLDGFTDNKLKNDVEYWYYIVAVFVVNGRRVESKGVSGSVTPHALVAPIENLNILKTENQPDEYVANWEEHHHNDVLLLASPEAPTFRTGEMVPVDDLLMNFRKLDIDARGRNSARFQFSFNGGMYIFAAAITGRYGAVGPARYLTNVKDVQSVSSDMISNDLFINLKWPQGLPDDAQVVACWRYDGYPASPEEPGVVRIDCNRQQYDYDSGVRISDLQQSIHYMKVHVMFITPEGEKVYSPGQELLVDNRPQQELFYSVKYAKPLFSSAYTVSLTIRSDREFVLPRSVVVGKIGRLPLKKSDGMPLFELDRENKVQGSVTFEYKTSLLPQNLFVRLFLRDDDLCDKFRLLPVMDMKLT